MSSEIALEVHQLEKRYRIYSRPQDRLKQALWRGRRQYFRDFVALHSISFQIRRGQTVGIVGRNGSGKSTLLQLLCGTLIPTRGEIQVHGRLAALLELGAGFHPDFTGRENVFLNAAILGLGREETRRRFPDIVAFAELEEFIDQPVKFYSSGMYVRLAFAVAVSADPEILIVDEALAVGDEAFQRKCFGRIQAIQAGGGTVLFVSHSSHLIVELCDQVLLLDAGELLLSGPAGLVVREYQRLLSASDSERQVRRERLKAGGASPLQRPLLPPEGNASVPVEEADYDPQLVSRSTLAYGKRGAQIRDPHLTTLDGRRVNLLLAREEYIYTYTVDFFAPAAGVAFAMMIKTLTGLELGGGATVRHPPMVLPQVEAGASLQVKFRFVCNLAPATYFLNAGTSGLVDGERKTLHRLVDAVMFRVTPSGGENYCIGMVDLEVRPSLRRVPRKTEEDPRARPEGSDGPGMVPK